MGQKTKLLDMNVRNNFQGRQGGVARGRKVDSVVARWEKAE